MFFQVQRPSIFLSGSGGEKMLKKALEGVSREVNSSSGTMQHSFSDSAIPRHSVFKVKHKFPK